MSQRANFLVSVIIPCYNEGSTIEDVIEAVKKTAISQANNSF
jgi:glycosyltransferase involved in cell wall biosynthesis